jgi:predicted transcriptional regulator
MYTTSIRLDADEATMRLLKALSDKLALPRSAVLRQAVRRLAEQEGIPLAED